MAPTGNRSTKVNAVDFNAFDSPNMIPLAKISIDIGTSDRTKSLTANSAYRYSLGEATSGPKLDRLPSLHSHG